MFPCSAQNSSGRYNSIDCGVLHVGGVVAMLPCPVLYLLAQRFYIAA